MSLAQVKAVLTEHEGASVDDLAELIRALYVDNDTIGGVYCVKITDIGGRPITFQYKEKNRFKPDDSFVLIKIGSAVNYEKRFAGFGFGCAVVFQVNGDSKMEDWLKKTIPSNFMKKFLPGTTAKQLKERLGFGTSNPGPTEWRIVSTDFYNKLVEFSDNNELDNLSYKPVIEQMCDETNYWEFEPGKVKICVGDDIEMVNMNFLIVQHVEVD